MSYVDPSDYLLYQIDWSATPKVRRAWYTNILAGMKGNEQRSMLRTLVRRSVSFTMCTMEETMTNELKRKINKNLHNVWGVPVWPYEMVLSQSVVSGETTLNVESTVGREVTSIGKVFMGNHSSYDIVTVASATNTTITLTGELPTKSYLSGAKIYPLLRADLGDIQEFNQPTPFHYAAEYTFTESFVNEETPL